MIDLTDAGKSGPELKEKYDTLQPGDQWSEHPELTHQDWAQEVADLNTLQGYWDWVASELESLADDLDHEAQLQEA